MKENLATCWTCSSLRVAKRGTRTRMCWSSAASSAFVSSARRRGDKSPCGMDVSGKETDKRFTRIHTYLHTMLMQVSCMCVCMCVHIYVCICICIHMYLLYILCVCVLFVACTFLTAHACTRVCGLTSCVAFFKSSISELDANSSVLRCLRCTHRKQKQTCVSTHTQQATQCTLSRMQA